jgi:ABC-type multidrug transport system ATPase subunit
MATGKLIIFSAPSGSGKSTIINYLLTQNLNLSFSISATSRPPRGKERHGVEYFSYLLRNSDNALPIMSFWNTKKYTKTVSTEP